MMKRKPNPSPKALAMRAWRADNPDTQKRYARTAYLKKAYGLTPQEFDSMLTKQQGKCGVCRDPLREGKSTHVDHDHETNKIRGLLCTRCNMALGSLRDDPSIADKAAAYLRRHKGATR